MTIAVISDTHIKTPNDEAYRLVHNFLSSEQVKEASTLIFLGDIFDLMVGAHTYYLKRFEALFDQMEVHLQEGKEIYFFEGNHDFHLESLFQKKFKDYQFFYHKGHLILNRWGKKLYFSHGDDLDLDNLSYKLTKFTLRNNFFQKFVDNLPAKIVHVLGSRWSEYSRKKNKSYFRDEQTIQKIRSKFRKSAQLLNVQKNYDYIVCGHSHIEDEYPIIGGGFYLNNGYPLHSKKCILLNQQGHQFYRLP